MKIGILMWVQLNTICIHCGAKRFKGENKSIFCANGQVELPPIPEAPQLLKYLLKNKEFQDKIQSYKAALVFASLGANEDMLPPDIYCYRIKGEKIWSLTTRSWHQNAQDCTDVRTYI